MFAWYFQKIGKLIQETDMEHSALCYAETHGICEYHLFENTMIYYTSWVLEGTTYKCTVDLTTMEEKRTPLKNYYKPYRSLIGGRYQANYNV